MYLTFSDSAKFADAARSFLSGQGLSVHHSFFDVTLLRNYFHGSVWPGGSSPLISFILSLFFRFLPQTDLTIAIAGMFLFVLSSALVYFIALKLHSHLTAIVAILFFLLNPYLIQYAVNASSEILFILIILIFEFVFLYAPGKLKTLSVIPLVLLFLTRQQAPVFLAAAALSIFIISNKLIRSILIISTIVLMAVFVPLAFERPYSPASPIKILGSFFISPQNSPGQYIRGLSYDPLSFSQFGSKMFYNLYNFVKDPARIIHPVVLGIFLISLGLKHSRKELVFHNFLTIFSLTFFILAASATLPNARYVHLILPLVIISSSLGLSEFVSKIKLRFASVIAVIAVVIIPTLGFYTLDARFRSIQYNTSQPPVYRIIPSIMAQNISKDKLIITNLDAWAAWYEGLTTMWFPLSPGMLTGYQEKIDYIVITNYKESDADFSLGPWKDVVYSPGNITDEFLAQNFRVLTTFIISPDQVYENQSFRGTILIRK
ncbi:hypothetical protein A3D85_01115 [Candidatus Amesbacteria bacterium RIFCSPHIGHO2_02_FULL_47_9]|uniref:Uncharacterized protein n=1 Tax=Candidatus Amesbacteria bacterium RIFCSPHIGHO2_01_FULL_48_32b TaxID=1797253 RepID=A0A1F4YD61_9BACT|nr:MAG: hypothetical protein A2876_03220 [Candidatus Amesbacteria bacterium RIFCSPHIGHO2_01_FULL_48_32b]OGD02945.1 MAG: hypothetical protein A3D85_01115 [Candidatus Amesbacteria bacterium RIFCSPHIGHO2_02_FULL_47_9]OGD08463.1 MAG: hypothetical protein A2899_01560 [Candidatus Amesbacteria bacterium RIFCSPLOWO2_01_FULL_49_25]